MTHFAGKAVKVLFFSAVTTLLLGATALAADQAAYVGAVTGSSVRMRTEASTSSSIITNLEKNTAVAVLGDAQDGWYPIAFNGQSGYVFADYLILDQDGLFTAPGRINGDGVNVRDAASTEANIVTSASKGTSVTVNSFADGWYGVTFQSGTTGYVRSDFVDLTTTAPAASEAGASIVAAAKQYLGTRYVYGGASPSGFDCSGFTMYIYNKFGVSLSHSATSQWQSGKGTRIYDRSQLQPGDLVFFCNPAYSNGKACSHVGIYIGGGQFIHSSSPSQGGVIISDLYSGSHNKYYVGGMHIL